MRKTAKKSSKKTDTMIVCGIEIYAPKGWRRKYQRAVVA